MIALLIGVGWVLATWFVLGLFRSSNSDVPTPQPEPVRHLRLVRDPERNRP